MVGCCDSSYANRLELVGCERPLELMDYAPYRTEFYDKKSNHAVEKDTHEAE